ncbi:dTMP kinase [Sodalinema gerasimenkoae]|uniref:dTMP kinase n=1 Tax=Sodalinema gerasimenkoae TaxID=2862348 RepID=UPI00135ACEB7|nr:dTMP kinase [Sodalinema gerasimenkoae]
MAGQLIVFEGIEGAGKTTQLQRAAAWLRSQVAVPVLTTREPGGTLLGQELRHLLLKVRDADEISPRSELLLYASDRAQHVDQYLKPNLAQGAIILCDRYTHSTLAYQGYGRQLDLKLIQQLNAIATGGLQPHLTFWLDLAPEVGLQRIQQRGEPNRLEREALAFHQRVRQGYLSLAQQDPERMIRLNAEAPAEEIEQEITKILQKSLGQPLS